MQNDLYSLNRLRNSRSVTNFRFLFCSLLISGAAALSGCGSVKDVNDAGSPPVAGSVEVPTPAGILFVSTDGDDGAAGTADAPLATIQTALDRVQPGGEVRVRPGVYFERLLIQNGGEEGRPVRVVAEAGAVLDGSLPVEPLWERAEDVGPGVWVTAMPFDPRCVTVDGKFLTLLNQARVTEAGGANPDWQWTTIFKAGINSKGRGATWKGVNGLGFYISEGERFYIRLQDQADPSASKFVFAPGEPAVTLDGASHLEFSGFEILNTPLGVKIVNAEKVVVNNCKIGPAREGVALGKESRDCVVKYCEIFQNPYSNYIPDEDSWETWTAHKRGGWWDMRGIKIEQTQGGHEIHDNHIHHQWDGISSMGWDHWKSTAEERLGWKDYNQNLNIHHNLIEDMNDDALEPNSAEINGQWHDNLIVRTRCALRVKVIDVGPLYLYRNLFHDNREDIRLYGELELNPAEVFIYHNTSTARVAIMSNKVKGIGTPNYHIYNNLFYARQWWGNTGDSVEPNWHGDYNVFVRQDDHSAWEKTREMAEGLPQDSHSRWVENGELPFNSLTPLDLSLTQQSPARSAGTDLEALFGRVLPGLEDSQEQPDAGAIPFGQAMPEIPRPR